MPKILTTAICLACLTCPLTAAWAQLPPTPSTYTPATVPPPSNAPAPAVTANVAVDTNYIWFGNDQTNYALQLIRSGRLVEALEVLDGITKINMRLPEVHLLRGVAYLQMKDLPRAEQAFNTVLAIDRGYLGAYVYLAQIALLRNNPSQVNVYLQAIRAVALTEDCAEYRFVKNSLRGAAGPPPDIGKMGQ